MPKILSIHSFRGGTGKSNTTANLAAVLALQGQRVGVIDTDIQSPGIHILFGLDGEDISTSLNDYLWHGREIKEVALDVTEKQRVPISGRLFLIPSSTKPGEITRVLREGYDAQRLTRGLRQLLTDLQLDTLIIDTHPGLNEETLLSLIISHVLVVVMRPDQQDYEGTGITMQVAKELQVPHMMIVVNKTPSILDPAAVKQRVEQAYGVAVAAVLPHSEEMMNLASAGIFALRYPAHPLTALYRQIAAQLET
jgi:MinD-like ATPase involved in chromosome partitioning or flagellar assembly